MFELIKLTGEKTPVVDSLTIAEGVNVQHKNIIELIRKYADDFQAFGPIAFETRMGKPLPQGGFAKATQVALLNEDQAMLLFTFLKNTELARQFKVRLIKAFKDCRVALVEARSAVAQIPQTLPEALRLAADIEEKRLALAAANLKLERQIAEDTPKREFVNRFCGHQGNYLVREVANNLQLREKFLFDWLHQHGWIYRCNGRWKAKRTTLDAKWLFESFDEGVNEKTGLTYSRSQLYITPKGAFKIHEMMIAENIAVPVQLNFDLQGAA